MAVSLLVPNVLVLLKKQACIINNIFYHLQMRKQEVERKRRLRMANALDQIKEILQENTV